MASNNRQYHAERFCLALPFTHECVIRRMAEPAKKPIAAATIKEPVGCRRTTCRKPLTTPLRSCSSTYNAVASSLSAVLVAQLSMISELWRPVLRTEEAAVRSAPAVSFRTSSSFLAAVLPRSSARSLASDTFAPSCDAVSIRFVICSVVLPPEQPVRMLRPRSAARFSSARRVGLNRRDPECTGQRRLRVSPQLVCEPLVQGRKPRVSAPELASIARVGDRLSPDAPRLED